MTPTASIGFRAKTGRAVAVALIRDNPSPTYLARWNVSLWHADLPEIGPYHTVLELSWAEAQKAVRPVEKRIEGIAIDALAGILKDLVAKKCIVDSVGVVGSPDRNLDRIGSPHIRAHAAEAILFRRVLEVAATTHNLRHRTFSDRDFEATAASQLQLSPEKIKQALTTIGRAAGKPWRADERAAATAAWLTLSTGGGQ
jgi:hypothetical protein